MFKDIPRTFETVVARDCWIWQHLDTLLLSEADKDRLLYLPDDKTMHPSNSQWSQYASQIALELETSLRWSEAQNYWFAASYFFSQEGMSTSADFVQAIIGIVRSGCRAAGMSPDDDSDTFENLVEKGSLHLAVPIQSAVVRSLLLVGTVQPTIYNDSDFTRQTRTALGQLLSEIISSIRQEVHSQRFNGTHEIFAEAVGIFTQEIKQLQMLIDGISSNPTIEYIKSQREKLLMKIKKVSYLFVERERLVADNLHYLLSTKFTNYLRYMDEVSDEVFNDFIHNVESIIEDTVSLGSYAATCLFAPLALCIGAAVNAHYQGNISSRFPVLRPHLLKPEASRTSNAALLYIEVLNEGIGEAEECSLSLQPRNTSGISFDPGDLWLGRIGPNDSKVQKYEVLYPLSIPILEVDCTLEWRDRTGLHTQKEVLKVVRQREIDWKHLDSRPTPYTIRSITEPDRLKGRHEQLGNLRFGFQAKGSFMITGQKRVGKTSLVKVLLSELHERPDVLTLYVPIGELSAASGANDIGSLGRDLSERVAEEYELKVGNPINIHIPTREAFRDTFNATFSRFIRQFYRTCSLQLAFALDDFDELPTQLFTDATGKAFFLALRALIDQGTSFFFIGSERLPAIMKEQAERLNQVKTLVVDYLDRDALIALIQEPAKGYLEYTSDAIVEIETWSAGNPYFATLICNAVWERALRMRDYWITKHDVKLAIQNLAETSTRNSYQHFWSDSPLARDEEREHYETKSSYIILSLSKHQSDPLAFAQRHIVVRNCEGLTATETEQHLQALIDHNIIEAHRENNDLVRIRVPLFTLWLKDRGAVELRQSLSSKGRLSSVVATHNELTPDEVNAVVEGLSYKGEKISFDQIRLWLAQFGAVDDQRLMLKLLQRLRDNGLFPQHKFILALSELHKLARHKAGERKFAMELNERNLPANWYITHVDQTGKSGSATVKQYRSENKIPTHQCGNPEKVLSAIANSRNSQSIIVCVDDFVGSGRSATEGLNKFIPLLESYISEWRKKVLLLYATVMAFETGIEYIEEKTRAELMVIPYKKLSAADKAFSEDNDIFNTADERMRARDIAYKIGSVLEKRHPLGWEDSQALVVFPDNVPNNTLPIFHKDGVEYNGARWKALFPRF